MQMAAKVVYHDHCYVMPVKQGATSLLFPSVSGLNTRIQGGKVVVVTSPDLPPTSLSGAEKPEEEELNEGIAHDHGYYHSTSGSEESQDEKPPESGNTTSKSLIAFDLPPPNKSGSAIAFGPTSSNMSFPDCQFSTLPAQIFAQDEEEGTSSVALVEAQAAAKLELGAEALVSPHPAEHTTRILTKEAVEVKKRYRKTSVTIVKSPPPPPLESVTPTRKGTRQRKPSTKVKEMQEEVEEKKSPTRKRKAVISIARPELVPYTPTQSEINTTTIHTILKSLPTALKERSRLTETDVPSSVIPKKIKKLSESKIIAQKSIPKKPGIKKRKKEHMEDENEADSSIEEELLPQVKKLAAAAPILPATKVQPKKEVVKVKPAICPVQSAQEAKPEPEPEPEPERKPARRGRPPKAKNLPEAQEHMEDENEADSSIEEELLPQVKKLAQEAKPEPEPEPEPERKPARRGRPPKVKKLPEAQRKNIPSKKTPVKRELAQPEPVPVQKPDVPETETQHRSSRRRTQSIVDQVQDVIKDIKQVECQNAETAKEKKTASKQDVGQEQDAHSTKDKAAESQTEPKKRGRGRPPKQKRKDVEKTSPSTSSAKTPVPKASPVVTPLARVGRGSVTEQTAPTQEVMVESKLAATAREIPPSSKEPTPTTVTITPVVSRGRGRPPKHPPSGQTPQPAKQTPQPAKQTPQPAKQTPQPAKQTPQPVKPTPTAKRGRKRKVPEEPQVAELEGCGEDLTIRFIPNGDVTKNTNHWGSAIPSDLLLRVFKQVIAVEGALPFMSRLSKVCRLWYEVGRHPSLWSRVDLSAPCVRKYKKSLVWLCRHRMAATTSLTLSGWNNLVDADLESVVRQCRALETMNLSGCSKLSSESIYTIANHCKQLTRVDLSEAWPSSGQYDKSHESMCYLAETVGTRLKALNLGINTMVQTEDILDALMLHCPNLEALDLSNCLFGNCLLKLPLEHLQEACPRLKHLLLGKSLFQVKDPTNKELAKCPGFAHLETLDISRSSSNASKLKHITDDVLKRLLRNAFDLNRLDVSGCRHITSEGLESLPIVSLKALSLAHCRVVTQPSIVDVILKWGFSLQDLDLSGNSVDEQVILRLVDGCPNLRRLDLTGCRGLPSAMRREHCGDSVIMALRTSLSTSSAHA